MGKRWRIGLLSVALIAVPVFGSGVARAVSTPTTRAATATTTAVTTAPAASSWHFEGRHSGVEHYQVHTKACPVLDHHLHETFTLTDGSAWAFRAHYCGTIDAQDIWTGVGSFTITTGTGSTLSGTFTDSAQLPSVGVPYALDINAGTGTFAGATGSCVLDVHLRSISATVQHQEGIFVCNLDH